MTLLKQYDGKFGPVRITQSRHDGTLAYYQNGSYHSQANRYGVSVCAYIHAMAEFVRAHGAKKILIIGCGGGTLATMLWRRGCQVTVVDIDPVAFIAARRHFHLPAGVHCICRDGVACLRASHHAFDAIIVDVFGAKNTVPPLFTSRRFFQRVRHSMAVDGLMVMNVMVKNRHDRRADIIACNAHAAKMNIHLAELPGTSDRNTLIVGGLKYPPRLPSGREALWIRPELLGSKIRGLKTS